MNDKFEQPVDVTALDLSFGGDMKQLLPAWDTIPKEFKNQDGTNWNRIVSRWFFTGLPAETNFIPNDGIDPVIAKRHLKAVLASWEPKHEHKEAGCAYLLARWFKDVQIPETPNPITP